MHPQQKHARFNLIVISAALVPAVLGYTFLITRFGPKIAMAAFGFLGVCGLMGFGGLYYRKSQDGPTVTFDERDQDIKRRAMLIAWGVQWLVWGSLCMVPWFVIVLRDGLEQTEGTVVGYLPFVYIAMLIVHQLVWSISVLVLYGKGAGDNDG